MKSFVVVLVVATMGFCGFFIQSIIAADPAAAAATTIKAAPADPGKGGAGSKTEVQCYECKESNVTNCGKMQNGWDVVKCSQLKCFEVNVLDTKNETVGTLRGCANDDKCSGAITEPNAQYALDMPTCKTCQIDSCNGNLTVSGDGHLSFTGSAVQCALISSLVVARMFFQKM